MPERSKPKLGGRSGHMSTSHRQIGARKRSKHALENIYDVSFDGHESDAGADSGKARHKRRRETHPSKQTELESDSDSSKELRKEKKSKKAEKSKKDKKKAKEVKKAKEAKEAKRAEKAKKKKKKAAKEAKKKAKEEERKAEEEKRKKEKDTGISPRMVRLFEKELATFMTTARTYMKERFPGVAKDRFRDLAPTDPKDGSFTPQEYEAAQASWMADPLRPFHMGQHQRVREAFLTVYRMLPRYYGCLYEDFMGPRFQLAYDDTDNDNIEFRDGLGERHVLPDPFQSKGFSEGLVCLLTHPIWDENLELLATCLQFVNIVRTADTRRWYIAGCDPESLFFKTWQRVILDTTEAKSVLDLFAEVKQRIGFREPYCKLFDQIVESIRVKRRPSVSYVSRRQRDDDPYFIKVIDISMLTQALDNLKGIGIPKFLPAALAEATVKYSRPDKDYPSTAQFGAARDRAMVYSRLRTAAPENPGPAYDSGSDILGEDGGGAFYPPANTTSGADTSSRAPRSERNEPGTSRDTRDTRDRRGNPPAGAPPHRGLAPATQRQESNSSYPSYPGTYTKRDRRSEVAYTPSPERSPAQATLSFAEAAQRALAEGDLERRFGLRRPGDTPHDL
ncbi:hypothetical protein GGR52DRAFT_587180 [Hypoxylon sp. FL1284]|nr:hypothetical protein GGR52DRAFT_587180 [Hypoxylon sp. FL1284]